jgi:UDP-N-acetylmuramate--alanine ligase
MKVHLVGIGGAGQSALAHLYLERGDSVSGSDAADSPVLGALRQQGARVTVGQAAANLGDPDLVVVSTAIKEDNPELQAARDRGLRVVRRGRAAADICAGHRTVAVAGTHGKTTTTTMAAAALAHLDPLVLSGGRLPGSIFNSRPGRGPVAIVEADESDRSFLELTPEVGIVTNIEADHLDRYRNLAEIERAFELFAARVSSTVVAGIDDDGARRLLTVAPGDVLSYGFDAADVQADEYFADSGGCSFRLHTPWGRSAVRLPVPGRHNARNALGAIGAGLALGQPLQPMVAALETVTLPGRRLELVLESAGARVYDDYGHHPTEVAATLAAARELGQGPLVCLFQPHMYTRLRAFLREFAEALGSADEVILAPVYAARDEPIPGIDSNALAAELGRVKPGLPVTVVGSIEELPELARERLRPGAVLIFMGAGDINLASARLAGMVGS